MPGWLSFLVSSMPHYRMDKLRLPRSCCATFPIWKTTEDVPPWLVIVCLLCTFYISSAATTATVLVRIAEPCCPWGSTTDASFLHSIQVVSSINRFAKHGVCECFVRHCGILPRRWADSLVWCAALLCISFPDHLCTYRPFCAIVIGR